LSRRNIEVAGLDHGVQPFPIATRVGPLVCTSAIHGRNRESGDFDQDPVTQIRAVFSNLEAVMHAAGGSLDDVGLCLVSLSSMEYRGALNTVWNEVFPDEHSRPSRNTQQRELTAPLICQVVATAFVSGD
jgi:2-iminobutanoate/2-iminopropanoate deaminase